MFIAGIGNKHTKLPSDQSTDIARSQDVTVICDMPNTSRPIITKELVKERLKTASQEGCLDGYYLYVGVTDDARQVKEAVEIVESEDRVVGMKMYAGRSVGPISVITEEAQKRTYQILADLNYRGVLVVHCEKESLFKMNLWNPAKAGTWNLARPIEACVGSIDDQMTFSPD